MTGTMRNVKRHGCVPTEKAGNTHGGRVNLPQISEKRPNTWHTDILKP